MRIKKQFLNEESLKPYGFRKATLFGIQNLVEYWYEKGDEEILVQRISGDVSIVIDGDNDTYNIPDVVYKLIKDGLVEVDE